MATADSTPIQSTKPSEDPRAEDKRIAQYLYGADILFYQTRRPYSIDPTHEYTFSTVDNDGDPTFNWRPLLHYATEIKWAMEFLMATMKAGAAEWYTASVSPSSSTDEWSCWFEPRYGDPEIIEYHTNPATAICSTCLKWWDAHAPEGGME